MTWSLNEVEATVRKAARGAGYSWGMAEEAGRAVRWLCAHALDGCGAFLRALLFFEQTAGRAPPVPVRDGDHWSAPVAPLCPLLLGVALADRASVLDGRPQYLSAVLEPIILLPFAAQIARLTGVPQQLYCPEGLAVTDGEKLALTSDPGSGPKDLVLGPSEHSDLELRRASRAAPGDDVWIMLNRIAHRTYAPATEASRLKGAGAGTSDND